ncbi:ExbD/TolR family protein [Flavobacterium artemisiae]|uniref:ExbD/TolR family protein n=1 Tax=Flavobacterium artemisiae TaxID=2126556 RepID=A0ABW4HII8_9FLAO
MKNLPQKVRSKKLNSRIDLTAMVSVSFLLIIFFMVVGELSKPKIMDLSLPDYDGSTCGRFGGCGAGTEHRLITVLLDKNDKIIMYNGFLDYPLQAPKEIEYGKNGIRKELQSQKRRIFDFYGDASRGPIVMIKPSKKSNFKNLVDILDEMAISRIDTYVVVDNFSNEEKKLLASQ